MKKNILYLLATVLMALSAVSCQYFEPDVIPTRDGDRITIPYRIKATVTKVSYAGGAYSFKSSDKLAISCAGRPDVEGLLDYDGTSEWSGDVSYYESEGSLDGETLTATLVHGDNPNKSTYANGIVDVVGESSAALKDAVENYSLFSANFNYGTNSVTLNQKACFLDATVTFLFEGGNFHLEGETSVDVIIDNSLTVSGRANLAKVGDDFTANFIIAMPGGTTLTDASIIQICDRDVQMIKTGTTKTLAANNKYTVTRTFDFKPQLGDPFWSDGTYGRIAHSNGASVVGIIVFVNNYEDSDDSDLAVEARALTEHASGFGHALVMSLKNVDNDDNPNNNLGGIKWAKTNAQYGTYDPVYITSPSQILETTNVSGYSNTNTLIQDTNNIAAYKANHYRNGEGDTMTNRSAWFLPSIGQWVYSISIRGFGGADIAENWLINQSDKKWLTQGQLSNLVLVKNNGAVNENLLVQSLNDRMQVLFDDFGCEYDSFGMAASDGTSGDNYWSSSENSAGQAIRMNFGSVETWKDNYYSSIKTNGLDKQRTSVNFGPSGFYIMKVRPFLAF